MKLYIKYMVSIRCKILVKAALDGLGIRYGAIELGEVELKESLTPEQKVELQKLLKNAALELIEDKRAVLIEKIKKVVVEMVHYSDEPPKSNFSDFLTEKLDYDYNYLAGLFSEVTGTTIEHFIISHKIEKAKELLLYDELNLTEISYKLNYSSVAHLSNQFKKVTGLTPTYFKKLKQHKSRIELEKL
ncbi:MAG: helix-turn-helix transcriptional regulator [Saprospiraceae bacterium]|nr:helix-turn-helix transcriptional regulator [Saprospiraceae bacterium]MBK9688471.1 helix-turn-helix transcriptional regulator [Saprospiraceae bacterium]